MKTIIKQYLPHLSAVIIFLVISVGYFSPSLLEGKRLHQGDIRNGAGMGQDLSEYRNSTGEQSLWASRMFSGMPSYQISPANSTTFWITKLRDAFWLWLPSPAGQLFMYMFGFFILLLALSINPWLAIVGAIAYGFSSYFLIIIEAGHLWKVFVLGFIPPTLAGIIWTYKGKYLLGGVLTALFLTLQLVSNHIQMTYYFLMLTAILVVAQFISDFKNKQLLRFLKASAVLLIAGLLAVGANISNIVLSAKYSEQTIRGKSELTHDAENRTSGLDRDYATQWSYGIGETFTLLIPNTKGGATGAMGMNHQKAVDNCSSDPNIRQFVAAQTNSYWGDQPFTSGPVYVGAFILFLFIFGLFIVNGHIKWVLLLGTVFAILLSWGHNFMGFSNLFFDYFPMYNKFRAVSSILIVAELCIPLLALLALWKIVEKPKLLKEKSKEFYISLGLTAGVALIFIIAPTVFFNFTSTAEAQQFAPYYKNAQYAVLFDALETARISVFRSDAWRSIIIILIGAGLMWAYSRQKIKLQILIPALALLVLFDLGAIDKRYLNNTHFVPQAEAKTAFDRSAADKFILQDTDANYRVFNLSVSAFQDASTSFFHKSIGGYHAAKLRRYQELIDHRLSEEFSQIRYTLENQSELATNVLSMCPTLNMLNTKYIIYNPNAQPIENPYLLGNSWFVDSVQIVKNADEEMAALQQLNPKTTAVVDERFLPQLQGFQPQPDDAASIIQVDYKLNNITYQSSAATEQLAVFSEIYYDDGLTRWDAYIDGQPATPIRVNYVLRALRIPAGEHTVEFIFKPKAFRTFQSIGIICFVLIILSAIAAVAWWGRKVYSAK